MENPTSELISGDTAPLKFSVREMFEKYGIRATQQRCGLAKILFGKGNRHLTAETLAVEAQALNIRTSLATVYNVLNLFSEIGLVRGLAIDGGITVFDTNLSDHSHFFLEDTKEVRDIDLGEINFADHIEVPEGYEISKVDFVVRLCPKPAVRSLSIVTDAVSPAADTGRDPATYSILILA